jgi:hypothetical protein
MGARRSYFERQRNMPDGNIVSELNRAGFDVRRDGVYCENTLLMDLPFYQEYLARDDATASALVRKLSRVWNVFCSVNALEHYLNERGQK